MKKIIEFFVKQHLFGDLLTVTVIGLGLMAVFLIRREVFPNVNFDIVTVVTAFPGASPDEVEKFITNPIEQDLKEVDGIKRIQSASLESRSGITVFLDPDQTTQEQGKIDIQDVIDRVEGLPESAEKSLVTSLQSKLSPLVEVSVSGDVDEMELRNVAKKIEVEIERVPGVARVVHRGLRDIEIRVEADIAKLARYRLSLDDLISALKRQNLSIPGGTVEVLPDADQGRERIVRTRGDFSNLDDVRKTVIRANELGQAIRVGDVAQVFYDLERATIKTRTNGVASLNLTVLKKEKFDAIKLVDSVKQRMEELKPQLGEKIAVSYINDFSKFIRNRLSVLTGNLAVGLCLIFILLPMLIPFRFSLLIGLGVPFAFLGTLLVLYNAGMSINLISMLGLIIVSGILVDDAIVVTENSVRMVEEGMSPEDAAIAGTYQMAWPVLASVATTAIVFLPMAFMSGIFGKFIREIPIGVIIALGVSVFEAFFILPAHIARWIKPGYVAMLKERGPGKNLISRFLERTRHGWENKLVPIYLRGLNMTLKHRYWTVLALLLLFIGSITLASRGMKFILFPPEGVETFFVRTEAPTGTSLDRHAMLIRPIEKALAELPAEELENFTTTVGLTQQDVNDPNTRRGSQYAQIAVFLTPETARNRTAAEIIKSLRERIKKPEGIERLVFARVNPGPPTGKPISIGVRGKNYDEIMKATQGVKTILADIPGVTDLEDNYTLGKRELRVNVNSAEAAAAGLSVGAVGSTVRAAFEGVVSTSIRELDEEIDVRVSLPRKQRSRASSLEEILVPNSMGNLIPLARISRITEGQGLAVYQHEDYQREVKVSGDVNTDVTTAVQVNQRLRDLLPELKKKHPNVWIDFGGEDEDTQESMASLLRAFVVALLGIFLILVMTFRSLLQPLLVLLTVPLGVIAVIWAFFLHGMPLSFMAMLGIIALAGVIVNNAIVLVDFVNQRRAAGADRWESITEAARTRVRPIFLTTATTVAGLFPTAYGIGGLDKFVVPIAMALAWGMIFGSVMTAFVFPAALAILDDLSEWYGRKRKPSEALGG